MMKGKIEREITVSNSNRKESNNPLKTDETYLTQTETAPTSERLNSKNIFYISSLRIMHHIAYILVLTLCTIYKLNSTLIRIFLVNDLGFLLFSMNIFLARLHPMHYLISFSASFSRSISA